MTRRTGSAGLARLAGLWAVLLSAWLPGCGAGGDEVAASGPDKTYLSVAADDAEGDELHYQWRVTAGHIDNRDAPDTVWTLPEGPGLHFVYVMVSDGKGGHTEWQYAVGSDALDTPAPQRDEVKLVAPTVTQPDAVATRLRLHAGDLEFTPGQAASRRRIYLPDVQVQVWELPDPDKPATRLVFSGSTDPGGELAITGLQADMAHELRCASTPGVVPTPGCGVLPKATASATQPLVMGAPAGSNLRLYGHVGMAGGAVCGVDNLWFGLRSQAQLQLQLADGTPLAAPVRVNRYGDYLLDAAVPVHASLQLRVQCEGDVATLPVPAAADPAGYLPGQAVLLSHLGSNTRPVIRRLVANGPEGNLRGRVVQQPAGVESGRFPASDHFLTLRGRDTRASACSYYRAIGAVDSCDGQGNFTRSISMDDWKRSYQLAPYNAGNTEAQSTYINQMDLNLVRRMAATQVGERIAFNVCNHPGPDGTSQAEVDQVMATALADEKMVACVSMAWSSVPGVARPFTQFLAFGPDGRLLPSVNLDGRGEKFLPGACIACHGSTRYGGRFPETGDPSPDLGARFLPFDTGNYRFPSRADLGETAQSDAIFRLNQLVKATEPGVDSATSLLIDRWYAGGSHRLDTSAVPPAWDGNDQHRRLYREVVGAACRTCHTAMGPELDWDAGVPGRPALLNRKGSAHLCGGGSDLVVNASMPNALISRDRLQARLRADPTLATLMVDLLGCDEPRTDPVYPRR